MVWFGLVLASRRPRTLPYPEMDSAETLFLGLTLPEDDPFRKPKMEVADCGPGFMITDKGEGKVVWEGDFIWLLCLTQEDDVRFELAQTVDGLTEMQAFFGGHNLTRGAAQLHELLSKNELWDVYRLRAVTILQKRVFDQLQLLLNSEEAIEAVAPEYDSAPHAATYETIMKLRDLEFFTESKCAALN